MIAVYGFCILNMHYLEQSSWLLLRAGPTDLRAKTGFLHKSGMPCICMGSQPIEARPNVAKFEGRWPKSVHNAGSNLGNGGTKWGIMLGKVPHTSWTGAHGRPRYPGKVWTESKQKGKLSCRPDSRYRGFLNFYVWFSSHICDVLSSLASSLLAQLL